MAASGDQVCYLGRRLERIEIGQIETCTRERQNVLSQQTNSPDASRGLVEATGVARQTLFVWLRSCVTIADIDKEVTKSWVPNTTRRCTGGPADEAMSAGSGTETFRVFLKYTRVTSPKLATRYVIGQR
ncbi:hypothetical protein Bbelb_156670 [Branchiostoma belcheri]|nr:hypothetical protein Bbelb_156670 [Branchiostoma belcheri]